MSKKILLTAVACMTAAALFTGCSTKKAADDSKSTEKKIVIGLSIGDLTEERWLRDRDMFTAKAKELGAEVVVQDANGDPNTQIQQCDNMLVRGVNVLVVIPKNADAAAPIVEKAHAKGIKVLSYDRCIANADVDLYVSFDNVRVGEIQAEEIVKRVPAGNYLVLLGDPGDLNAKMLDQGQSKILQPLIDAGKIKVVLKQSCDKWGRPEARRITEDVLSRGKIDAVVASNDGTASGALAALETKGLSGKVPISGQDANLEACQYVVQGKQTVTVYKPIKKIAEYCAQTAIAMAKGEEVKGINNKVNNGKIDVPTVFLDPIPVTKENMDSTIIADGFHAKEEVYKQ